MSITAEGAFHCIKAGEWVSSVAAQSGIDDWRFVWDHSANEKLRQQRQTPDMLVPGDMLFVPCRRPRSVSCQTKKRHTFRRKIQRDLLTIRFLDEEGQAVTDARYEITLDEPTSSNFVQQNLMTDGQGHLEERIPRTARSARIEFLDRGVTVLIEIGHLRPIDSSVSRHENVPVVTQGVEQRLSNLMFAPSEGEDRVLAESVRSFQNYCRDTYDQLGLNAGEPDGRITPEVRKALLEIHDASEKYE